MKFFPGRVFRMGAIRRIGKYPAAALRSAAKSIFKGNISAGSTRITVLVGPYALKFTRFDQKTITIKCGIVSNRIEYEKFNQASSKYLCPVVGLYLFGSLLIMKRVKMFDDNSSLWSYIRSKSIPVRDLVQSCREIGELRCDNFGVDNAGNILCVDYGRA